MKILSTKSINSNQKERFNASGIEITDYDAISINPLDFDNNIIVPNAIITSQNAAQIIINNNVFIKNCFCVGNKTKTLLESNGLSVTVSKKTSLDLANYIKKKHQKDAFWYFCSSKRLDDLPKILNTLNIALKEVKVYETLYNEKTFHNSFDGVMFYSPSGIESYTKKNNLKSTVAYCIGNTTAQAAKIYTDKIIIAKKPSLEDVIDSVLKDFKKNDKKRLIS